jgi:hypothetical protein
LIGNIYLQDVKENSDWDDDGDEKRVREADDDDGAQHCQQVVDQASQNHRKSHLIKNQQYYNIRSTF